MLTRNGRRVMKYFFPISLIWVFCIIGCSERVENPGSVVIVDKGWSFVTGASIHNIEEATYVPGEVFSFTITAQSLYAGKGWASVSGRNGGNEVGQMITPGEGPIGTLGFPVDIPAGRIEIPVELFITTESNSVGLDVYLACDSLLVKGKMVHWMSEEGHSVYSDDVPPDTAWIWNDSGQINTVYREEEE